MLFFPVVRAIAFAQRGTSKFLGQITSEVTLIESPDNTNILDINLLATDPPSLNSVLSLGVHALSFDRKTNHLRLEKLNPSDKAQAFKLVMLPEGSFVMQFDDGCLGFEEEHHSFIIADCTDHNKVLRLNKTSSVWNNIQNSKKAGPTGYDINGSAIYRPPEVPPEYTGFSYILNGPDDYGHPK